MKLVNTIKENRKKHKINQTQLAEAIGMSLGTIHAIESGKFNPSTLTALKIARYFNSPFNELFKLEY